MSTDAQTLRNVLTSLAALLRREARAGTPTTP